MWAKFVRIANDNPGYDTLEVFEYSRELPSVTFHIDAEQYDAIMAGLDRDEIGGMPDHDVEFEITVKVKTPVASEQPADSKPVQNRDS